jgi:four helix bundle protein
MIKGLEDFKVYNLSMVLAEDIWSLVSKWNYFEKDTIGKQLVRAADSIAANLSEGLGRYHFKESKNFSYYSRGSLFETKTWLTKSLKRKLLTEHHFEALMDQLDVIGKMLNSYINSIGTVNEPFEEYSGQGPTPKPQ